MKKVLLYLSLIIYPGKDILILSAESMSLFYMMMYSTPVEIGAIEIKLRWRVDSSG